MEIASNFESGNSTASYNYFILFLITEDKNISRRDFPVNINKVINSN